MNIDLNLYYVFYTVAKYESITKASIELYISQPAVTQSIKTLENNIGATLFIRTKKGVTLTEEAKVLYKYVSNGIAYIQNGEKKFQELMNLQEGTLKIGASTTVTGNVLLPYLQKFANTYPNINIQINNNLTSELINLLRNGTVDLLILNLPTKETSDLEITPFLTVHDTFVVNSKYKNLLKKENKIKDLTNESFIFQKSPSNTRNYLNKWLEKENIEITPKLEVVSFSLVKNMTKKGMGIGYLTKEFIKNELDNEELFELPLKHKIPPREIGIVTLKKNIPSFAARALLDMILKKN